MMRSHHIDSSCHNGRAGQLEEEDSLYTTRSSVGDAPEWDDFTALTGDPTAHVDVPLMSIRGLEGRSGQMGMHYLFRHGRYPIMVEEQQGDGWEVVGDR
jgi:hypothetical protein